jgi:hypothetical protein
MLQRRGARGNSLLSGNCCDRLQARFDSALARKDLRSNSRGLEQGRGTEEHGTPGPPQGKAVQYPLRSAVFLIGLNITGNRGDFRVGGASKPR